MVSDRIRKLLKRYEWADLLYLANAIVLFWSVYSMTSGIRFLNMALFVSSLLSSVGRGRRWWGLAFMPYILTMSVFIRIQNLPLLQGEHPLALDPYYFLRMARTYLELGHYPAIDMLRAAPHGLPMAPNFFVLGIVYTYKLLAVFVPSITLEMADILNPVIYFAVGLVFFYLAVKKAFNPLTAIISSLLLSVIPAYLYRTTAGFSDHESFAFVFMFVAIWAFIPLTKEHSPKNYAWALLSGAAIGFMRLSWGGGVRLLFFMLLMYFAVLILIDRFDIKQTAYLAVLLLGLSLSHIIFSMGLSRLLPLLKEIYFIPFFGLVAYGVILHLVRDRLPKRWPTNYVLMLSLGVLALVGGIAIIGWQSFSAFVEDLIYTIFIPLGSGRLTLTVAENRVPYLQDWIGQFGFFFWVFLAGGAYLAFTIGKKYRLYLLALVTVLVMTFLLSNKDPYSALNGTSTASLGFFLGGVALVFAAVISSYLYAKYRNKDLAKFIKGLPGPEFFMLIWWLSLMLSARGGIRIFVALVLPATVMAGYLLASIVKKAVQSEDWPSRIGLGLIVAFLFIPTFASGFSTSLQQARYTGPGFNAQWQSATDWISTDTDPDSVFAHWWDYGYWVQTEGNRATVLDGGNTYAYWNHLLARHVLAGSSYEEALEFLYVHNVTHLLIISDEIGKYSAYSSIGSDEEFDIFSWIGNFVMNPRSTSKEGDITSYYFVGGSNLDEDFTFKDEVFSKEKAVISGFRIPIRNDDDPRDMEVLQPFALVVVAGELTEVPVQCIYDDGIREFDSYGIGGCIRIFPRIIDGRYEQENGALLWVSRRGFSALWTRLFLFEEENPYFELVYDDSNRYRLAYYGGRTRGPLRIWKVNYPENFTVSNEIRAEYLNTTTEYWERLNEENRYKSPLR